MGKLIYSAIASLDGYVEDADGTFAWAKPDEEVHSFVNELERTVGTYLYGRRMYQTMVFWERPPDLAEQPPFAQQFAEIWQGADKIVYSKSLQRVTSARTRIEREFDAEAVRQLKETADLDLTVGGPGLAAQAVEARLVDEYQLFLVPVVIGGGKRVLPTGSGCSWSCWTNVGSATGRPTSTTAPAPPGREAPRSWKQRVPPPFGRPSVCHAVA